MDITRDDILHGLFTTAIEGGITYWASVDTYRWSKDGDGETDDLKGFTATVSDAEGDNFGGDEDDTLTIDRSVIKKGLERFLREAWVGYKGSFADDVRQGNWDECDYDADIADCVVQLGLFKEIRFG